MTQKSKYQTPECSLEHFVLEQCIMSTNGAEGSDLSIEDLSDIWDLSAPSFDIF